MYIEKNSISLNLIQISISKQKMKTSPIKLNSSSKAKLKATKSPQRHNVESQLILDDSRIRSSVHTLPIKQSPNKFSSFRNNFTPDQVEYAKSQHYNNLTIMRSGSPVRQDLSCSVNMMKNTRSFSNFVSPKKNLQHSVLNNETLPHIVSPSKTNFNDRSFIKIDVARNSPVKVLAQTTRFVSPPKIIQHVQYQPSSKQIQLERKVRILQARIGELHLQKNQIQTQMNQLNVRLQYQNNFLRQKLNSNTLKSQNRDVNQRGLVVITKKVSFPPQKQNCPPSNCSNCQATTTLSHATSQKLIKDLEKSEQNQYHQSKEIHSLKQQLLQTEEMLSKQINKSLQLLEQLALKQRQNEELKVSMNEMSEKIHKFKQNNYNLETLKYKLEELSIEKQKADNQILTLKAEVLTSNALNQNLSEQIYAVKEETQDMLITKDLLNDLEQNNQLLIEAIRSLQATVKQSQKQINELTTQKSQLQSKIREIQNQLDQEKRVLQETQNHYNNEVQQLSSKILDIESELIEKNTELQALSIEMQNKERMLLQKQVLNKNQQTRIQTLMSKHQELELNSSTANSFYNKNLSSSNKDSSCSKCDELRKTIFKLNNHLNHNIKDVRTSTLISAAMKKTY